MDITISGVDKVLEGLSKINDTAMRSAIRRALNRAATAGQVEMARKVAGDTGIKVGDIKKALKIQKASDHHLEATIGASTSRLPLIYFKPKETRKGMSYDVGRGRRTIPGAFVAKLKSSHVGIFKRNRPSERTSKGPSGKVAWSKNLPIDQLHGPSLGRVFKKYRPDGLARMQEAFDTTMNHELDRILTGQGGGDGGE